MKREAHCSKSCRNILDHQVSLLLQDHLIFPLSDNSFIFDLECSLKFFKFIFISKDFIEFVTILLSVSCFVFWPQGRWDLS